ncbi:hypothetical protein, partial [uncultured Rikenella sp.]|uniref:hypothetical protein n=1 Tax=uncultured Rikenella sp. TaxID=368003 RepID=UPI002604718B
PPIGRICLLKRAGDCRALYRTELPYAGGGRVTPVGQEMLTHFCGCVSPNFRTVLCPRAFGKSSQNVPAHFDDFLLKVWRAFALK